MFAPEGYMSFEDLSGELNHWQGQLILAECNAKKISEGIGSHDEVLAEVSRNYWPAALVDAGLAKNLTEAHTKAGFHNLWMLANFMHRHRPYLCSPSGTLLSAPFPIYDHADNLYWCPWNWELENSNELSKLYSAALSTPDLGKSIGYRFPCLDIEHGLVVEKNHQLHLMASAYGDLSDLSRTKKQFERLVRPFLGYSLCWREDELPDDWSDVFAMFGASGLITFMDENSSEPPSDTSKQRHSLRNTYLCLLEVFPDGKGDSTWQDVEERVGYSRRQINRALEMHDNMAWRNSSTGP